MAPLLLTAPPLVTVSVPVAVPPPVPVKFVTVLELSPTIRLPEFVQVEPAPVMVTVPTLLAPTLLVSRRPKAD